MLTTSNPPSTISVPVATTASEGKTKVDNNMTGDPVAITTHSKGIPSGIAELDAGGLVPVAELPLDVAYTDVENTFTETQLVDDGFGNTTNINPDNLVLTSNDVNNSYFNTDSVLIYPETRSFVDVWGNAPSNIMLINFGSGGDLAFNVFATDDIGTFEYREDGPATRIHQDVDGTIHFETSPSGLRNDDITWADALIINNDGTTTLPYPNYLTVDGTGDQVQIQSDHILVSRSGGSVLQTLDGSVVLTDSLLNLAEMYQANIFLQDGAGSQLTLDVPDGIISLLAPDPTYMELVTTDTNLSGTLSVLGTGSDLSQNTKRTGSSDYAYRINGPATNIHQDIDGTIHLQVSPIGMALDPITWTDALIINNNGTVSFEGSQVTDDGFGDKTTVIPATIVFDTANSSRTVLSTDSSYMYDVDGNQITLTPVSITLSDGASNLSTINNDSATIDGILTADSLELAASVTTTTAPAAGMADALPILPTGYITVKINNVDRQIAYY